MPSKAQSVLLKLLAEQDVLQGLIRRITPHSVFFRFEQQEIEIPLNTLPKEDVLFLLEGQHVEVKKQAEQTITFRILPPAIQPSQQEQKSLTPRPLADVLLELNIPPTEEAVLVAQGLLERGFGVQESLVWNLLPWAEQGQLEEAFLLLQGRFPLKAGLLEVARRSETKDIDMPRLSYAKESMSPNLRELFQKPSFASRAKWSANFAEGETFKALVRLLVEERLLESLLTQRVDLHEYVFALPFLRGEDLYAGWVHVKRENESNVPKGEKEVVSFCVEVQIPTKTLGLIGAEIRIQGKSLGIQLKVDEDGSEFVAASLQTLKEELGALGWQVGKIQVGGWDHAQSSSLTL